MAPIYIKGGVWSNAEDQCLIAAVSKYGLNQWSRVSTLLNGKTAKQAKARWQEWLDPSIKKIEWSREEDEKLLHLAKVMPTQWRTIAVFVGRTASQCLERYQTLLDDAEQKDPSLDALKLTGVGGGSTSGFRIGDINPNPETRPAKPDSIDMDDEEKEMLSEARARLANTQGKKAKRKDRERTLEQSKRLSKLLAQRQLKQAGENIKFQKRKKYNSKIKVMDYNAGIPFEKKPLPGFYDTTDEDDEAKLAKQKFDHETNKRGIPNKDSTKEKKKRNLSNKNDNNNDETKALQNAAKFQNLKETDQISKRRKLNLPPPQVSLTEIDNIVKFGHLNKQNVEEDRSGTGASVNLIANYSSAINIGSTRTPMVASEDDKILNATRELRAMTQIQSSLLGGENTPYSGNDTSSSTNNKNSNTSTSVMQTPNPLVSVLPLRGAPSYTPVNDELGINRLDVAATPRKVLRQKLFNLPRPKNDFEILLPEEDEVKENDNATEVEDEGEKQRKIQKEKEEEEKRALLRRSQVIQNNLPLPTTSSFKFVYEEPDTNNPNEVMIVKAQRQVDAEMQKLVKSDKIKYEGHTKKIPVNGTVPDLDDDSKKQALSEVEMEVKSMGSLKQFTKNYLTTSNLIPFQLPGITSSTTSEYDDKLLHILSKQVSKANKVEKKITTLFAGYMKRQGKLSKKIIEANQALLKESIEENSFEGLRQMEEVTIDLRANLLQEPIDILIGAEKVGQEKYLELSIKKNQEINQ